MRVVAQNIYESPAPNVIAEPQDRAELMTLLLLDCEGDEELYLSEIARAEAGATVLDLRDSILDTQLYPDGRVILEELHHDEDEEAATPPRRLEMTLAELRELILKWLEAKRLFYAQRAGGAG